jgi:hypothetical protein
MTLSDKKSTKSPVIKEHYNKAIVKRIEEYISVQCRLSYQRTLYHPMIEQVKSGLGTIPIKISYFKHVDQIYQWMIETYQSEVEKYLKLAIIKFARSQNAPVVNPDFSVRLLRR